MGVIRGLVDGGVGAIVATHDPRLAAWADRVVFMRDGRIVDETRAGGADAGQWPWGAAERRGDDEPGDASEPGESGEIARVAWSDRR